jgi:hypothetical protein
MSARQALIESAKKATDASREQVHWYVGANDYWYEQLRRQPVALQELSNKVSKLSEVRLSSLRSTVSDAPKTVVNVLQEQLKVARDRRAELAARGEAITQDWYSSVAAQDASAFVAAVRDAKNPTELANAVRHWYWNFDAVTPGTPKPAAEAKSDLPKPAAEAKSEQPKPSPRKAAPPK